MNWEQDLRQSWCSASESLFEMEAGGFWTSADGHWTSPPLAEWDLRFRRKGNDKLSSIMRPSKGNIKTSEVQKHIKDLFESKPLDVLGIFGTHLLLF